MPFMFCPDERGIRVDTLGFLPDQNRDRNDIHFVIPRHEGSVVDTLGIPSSSE